MDKLKDLFLAMRQIWNTSIFKSILTKFTTLGYFFNTNSDPTNSVLFHFTGAYLKSSFFLKWWFEFSIKNWLGEYNLSVPNINAFIYMQKSGIFNEVNFTVLKEKGLDNFNILEILGKANLVTQANFDVLAGHENYASVASILEILKKNNLLNQDYFDRVSRHANPEYFRLIFDAMQWEKLLTKENFELLIQHKNPKNLATPIIKLFNVTITQKDIEALINPVNAVLLEPEVKDFMWDRLAKHHLRTNWPRILEIARGENPLAALRTFTDNLLGVAGIAGNQAAALNGAQSTHTASVHATTDLTAWLLNTYYRSNGDTDLKSFTQIKKLLTALTPNGSMTAEQINKAKKCLDRLERFPATIVLNSVQKKRSLCYIQSELVIDHKIADLIPVLEQDQNTDTEITLYQFIQYLFKEISSNNEKGQYEEAFVLALFEIQRGYNIDESGQDNGDGEDMSICFGATANKFCECLIDLSPYIQFIYTSPESIAAKIKPLLLDKLLAHCHTLLTEAQAGGVEERQKFCSLINDLKNPEKVIDVYKTLFSKESFLPLLIKEFKANTLLTGNDRILTEEIDKFEVYHLPYLYPIDLDAVPNCIYTVDFLTKFREIDNTRIEFEATKSPNPASTASALNEHGVFATAVGESNTAHSSLRP